ncbi:MAG: GWxTD domain-containing protein [Candidatus Marinimicrobia bacterium]|nr:GWxTD domain-containing protein [Candidatus Neomarinimicrobiota bacterium]MBT3759193.1 GWxTD domain-containing protein [Candidatus Neomarinimicrobiota bacterium]MBT3895534.1 GWxTD domain-containing protein [Candidatus Neomarinimicrobiota bacterium]MBT4537052.1 GWxTD domain-containing protein [Candidatus Neomarinimicrobiota bacterium]MBT6216653.1 GWxTD domain-containing protein [Candidatus Neomarinimicrobiota bacterium]
MAQIGEWHFIIGAGIINKNSAILILIALFTACSTGNLDRKSPFNSAQHKLWINHYKITESDSFHVDITIHSPNPFFIFSKHDDHFKTQAEFQLSVTDVESDKQVYRKSWVEDSVEFFYEDTRQPERFVNSEFSIYLDEGKYEFSLMVFDKDSKHNWNVKKEVDILTKTSMSEIFPVYLKDSKYLYTGDQINLKIGSFFLRFQIPLENDETEILTKYTISDMGTIILSDSSNIQVDEKGFIYLPISIDEEWLGVMEFKVTAGGYSNNVELSFINTSIDKYFQDIPLLVQVMSLILEYDDYKELSKLEPIDQKLYVYNYWRDNDPTPETKDNELLMEFYGRVEYSNSRFGTLSSGWKSDRGIVYIQNGKPSTVEVTGRDNYGRAYEIWTYSDHRQYVFLDDGFGEYRLYRQTN